MRPVVTTSRARLATILVVLAALCGAETALSAATVLYLDRTVEIAKTLPDPTDLWVEPDDLTRINGFVLKPEGACLDELCIPIPRDEESGFVVRRSDTTWFSVTAFADKIGQQFVVDRDRDVWSFGEIPVTRSSFLRQAQAPDFVLPDREGRPVRLSELRGKKVLLLTWASW